MASIGESSASKGANQAASSGFIWVSSSPTPTEIAELECRFPEVISISSAALEASSSGWKDLAILARTFLRWIPPEAYVREFRRAGVAGGIQHLSLAHRCHIFRFEEIDAKKLVIGRPWVINGQPVAMEDWRPEFIPASDSVASALLWVRLPSLPVEFWSDEMLRAIIEPAGEFLFADPATRQRSRGGFARVCVRLDLRRPLRPGVRIQGVGDPFWQPFQFENLDGICSHCASIHLDGPCDISSPAPASVLSPVGLSYGPWMAVLRRRRSPPSEKKTFVRHPDPSFSPQFSPSVGPSAARKSGGAAEGGSSPAKGGLRRPSSTPIASPRGLDSSVFDRAPLKHGSDVLVKGPFTPDSVPADVSRAGFRKSKMLGVSETIPDGAPKVKLHNPFAILADGKEVELSPARSDANPGPAKRPRPVESRPVRLSVMNEKGKGKGTGAVPKRSKAKINSPAGLSIGKVSFSLGYGPDKSAMDQESGTILFGGLSSKGAGGNPVVSHSLSSMECQDQIKDSAPPAPVPCGLVAGSEGSVPRTINPSLECVMQAEEGGALDAGYPPDRVMMDDQGVFHPPPNCK